MNYRTHRTILIITLVLELILIIGIIGLGIYSFVQFSSSINYGFVILAFIAILVAMFTAYVLYLYSQDLKTLIDNYSTGRVQTHYAVKIFSLIFAGILFIGMIVLTYFLFTRVSMLVGWIFVAMTVLALIVLVMLGITMFAKDDFSQVTPNYVQDLPGVNSNDVLINLRGDSALVNQVSPYPQSVNQSEPLLTDYPTLGSYRS